MGGRGASSGVVGSNSAKLNPYAKAFVKENGKFNAVDYINWINNKHAEFRRINNITVANMDYKSGGYDSKTNKKFIEFLNKQ